MKIDPPKWADVDCECMTFRIDDPQHKFLFKNKPVAVSYNIVKISLIW